MEKTLADVQKIFHERLLSLFGPICEGRIYFSPPSNFNLGTPCIVYTRENPLINRADGCRYIYHTNYLLTVVDEDPNSKVASAIEEAFECEHLSKVREFVTDGLYHFVYRIYI